jgi:hypothetical protein
VWFKEFKYSFGENDERRVIRGWLGIKNVELIINLR